MSAVIKAGETLPVVGSSPSDLLVMAVQQGADVDKLSKLMDLQERWQREQARRAYYDAKAKFQSLCPEIKRDREVSYGAGKAQYKYATLAGIASQVRGPLSACGLTYRWEIHDRKVEAGEVLVDFIEVTCILSHVDGHSESNTMSACPDNSGSKNLIQQRGSTVTYLQRYTLIGTLGLSSANDDDDGKSSGALNVETLLAHNEALRNWFDNIYAVKTCIGTQQWQQAIEAWDEVPHDDQRALWLATTKGGIFTTEERRIIKSDEWAKTRREMGRDAEASE